jgi:hypothetical protein
MNAETLVDEARGLMEQGKDGRAADMLITAATECRDPALAARIRDLGADGLARAGRFRRGRWQEVVRLAEARTASPA